MPSRSDGPHGASTAARKRRERKMPVESGTYISDLVATNPVGATDPKSQGDDHIRLLKSTIKATFPNIAGAGTASHTQLSTLAEGTLPACHGSQLTDLNGDEVKTGTVADARLSSNVPLKDQANTFTDRQTFTAPQVGGNGAVVLAPSSGENASIIWYVSNASTDEKRWRLRAQANVSSGT